MWVFDLAILANSLLKIVIADIKFIATFVNEYK